jgi:hypothetical protein
MGESLAAKQSSTPILGAVDASVFLRDAPQEYQARPVSEIHLSEWPTSMSCHVAWRHNGARKYARRRMLSPGSAVRGC